MSIPRCGVQVERSIGATRFRWDTCGLAATCYHEKPGYRVYFCGLCALKQAPVIRRMLIPLEVTTT